MSNSMPRFHGFKMQAGHGGLGVPVSNRSRSQVLASGMEPAHQMAADSGHGMDPGELYSFNEQGYPPSPIAVLTPTRMPCERHGVVGNVGSRSPEFFGSARRNQGPRSIPSVVVTPVMPARRVTTERRVSARRSNHGLEPRIGGGRTLCFSDKEEVTLEKQQRQPRLPSKSRKAIPRRSSSNVSIESEPVDIPCSNEPERDTSLEEEGWSSLWDNYTRVFPGTHGGCSPPRRECRRPPESPLYFTPKNHSNTTALLVTPPTSRPCHSSSFNRRDADSATSDQKTEGRGRVSQMALEDREGSRLGRAARSIGFAGAVVDQGGDWSNSEESCVGATEDSDCTSGLIFDMEL